VEFKYLLISGVLPKISIAKQGTEANENLGALSLAIAFSDAA
jgi:hypothetical protein